MRACNYRLVFKKLVTTEKEEHLDPNEGYLKK